MDFGGPERSIRVVSLHPGVSLDEVRAATGFELAVSANLGETPPPTEEQLAIIRRLDPHNLRATAIKNNPPGIRAR
jgi:glutaconate CoA-transferase subunit B